MVIEATPTTAALAAAQAAAQAKVKTRQAKPIPKGRQYYTTGDLITRTGFSYAFWSNLRTKREGPPFITVSTRKTLYPIEPFETWLSSHLTLTSAS